MNAFLLLYAMAISIELILSMLMALFLFLIASPLTSGLDRTPSSPPPGVRPLACTVDVALADAFAAISEGRDDLAAITNARSKLVQYSRERRESLRMPSD